MSMRLIPDNTNIHFMRWERVALVLSIVMIIGSFALMFTRGLNFGIDFEGGSLIEVHADKAVDLGPLRAGLNALDLGEVAITSFGSEENILIRLGQQSAPSDDETIKQQEKSVELVKAKTREIVGGKIEFARVENVGPKVSGELVRGGVMAIVIAMLATAAYIWFRFEWQFGIGAMVSLIHDVALTIGLFSLFQFEFNLTVIAALLTIVGYSLNDTVVVFDRIRENLRKFRKMELNDLIDLSLNETLARTIMTSITTALAVGALLIFGGEVIRAFSVAMLWGIVIGTYSSIYIAAPIINLFKLRRDFGDETDPATQREG
ncbi:protein translocase subunit SecF [Govanella unica]|uniref:Protein-export membrane protein SecF n=1 Tax=Govanella unica TaxID=2975056 RepID=A0A9X3Z7A1_9PROT|nr:protein translocase subunit SecF [Govania unica]MDA5193951.1 protein translocase subunit SecF [Govania unica]